jgi:membrane protein
MTLNPWVWLERIGRATWDVPPGTRTGWHARLWWFARLIWALARDLASGQIALRAMSLVYTTLLSLVPLLAVSFSVLKAFGVHNQIEPFLNKVLAPLGADASPIAAARIVQFIENVSVGVLGTVGLVFFLYTAITLMQKIEEAFNFIWHVPCSRGVGERVSRYLTALIIGPVLVLAALGLTASVMNNEIVLRLLQSQYLAWLAYAAGKIAPYLLVVGTFTFLYLFIPNTRVEFIPALVAGVVGGVLWQTAGWAFTAFVAGSSNYRAIYASFAVLVLFMIWLYVSWYVLLFGANVGFYVQHPEYLGAGRGEFRLRGRLRESIALAVMSIVATRHRDGAPAATVQALAKALSVPSIALQEVLDELEHAGLLAQALPDGGYLPARDPHSVPVSAVMHAVRHAGENPALAPSTLPLPSPVVEIIDRVERSVEDALQRPVASLATPSGGIENRPASAQEGQPTKEEKPSVRRSSQGS